MTKQDLSNYATECFFGEPNGGLNFEFYRGVIMARAQDVIAAGNYQDDPSFENMVALFAKADPQNLATTRIGNGLSGEWFNKIQIGRDVTVGNNLFAMGHGGIEIGDRARIGNDVMMITVGHGTHASQRHLNRYGKIKIEDDVIIEDGVMIVHPANSRTLVIPAGSVVRKGSLIMRAEDVQDPSLSPGILARNDLLESSVGILKITDVDDLREQLGVEEIVFMPPVYVNGAENAQCGKSVLFNNSAAVVAQGDIIIGDRTLLAPKACVYAAKGSSIDIGGSVWIGAGVTIEAKQGQRLHIGEGSLIAAGAHVTEDIPPHSLVVGHGTVKRGISEQDIRDVPSEWMDQDYMQEQISRSMTVINAAQQGQVRNFE